MQKCKKCGIDKLKSEFYKCSANKSGIDKRCKSCSLERAKKSYNSEKEKAKYKAWRAENPSTFIPKTPLERLMEKIEIITESGCWIFMGYIDINGYGMIGGENIKVVLAHRLSYKLFHGELEEGLFVCHKCDIPSCCNPHHLFLGTQKDNMADAARKKRMPRGEKNARSKLTIEQIRMIIECKKSKGNLKKLTKELPVTYNHVCQIASGKITKYVTACEAYAATELGVRFSADRGIKS